MYWLSFIGLFTLLYYIWIAIFQNQTGSLTWGGNILSLVGTIIPSIWLLNATKRSSDKARLFWLLLTLGTFSYFIAEVFSIAYDSLLLQEVPYPGISDVFYLLNTLLYISAFVCKLYSEKRKLVIIRYLFDIMLVMIMFITISWYFILNPILNTGDVSLLAIALSLAYPIGNLVLILCVVTLYFTGQNIFSNKILFFLAFSLLIYIFADMAFVYLISINAYYSGSWTDPLFILGVILIGYTGLLQEEEQNKPATSKLLMRERLHLFHILFPYISLTMLFIFMIITTTGMNAIIIGVGVSIVLVTIRQFLIISDNQLLLVQYLKNVEELEANQERYRSLFDHHPDAVYSFNLDGIIESVNEKGSEILCRTREELIGRPLINFIHQDYQKEIKKQLVNVKKGIFNHYDLPLANQSKEFYYLSITHVPMKLNNNIIGVYAIARDVTKNKINEEQIHYMAFHDHLTHLANRICFENVLATAIKESEIGDKKFAILFLDLNNFKSINDEHGHAFGDALLADVASRIKSLVTQTDYGARLGGDEFTILIDDLDSYDEAVKWSSQLLTKLSQPYIIEGCKIINTPSIGYAFYPKDGTTIEALLKKADMSMYENKRQSKVI